MFILWRLNICFLMSNRQGASNSLFPHALKLWLLCEEIS